MKEREWIGTPPSFRLRGQAGWRRGCEPREQAHSFASSPNYLPLTTFALHCYIFFDFDTRINKQHPSIPDHYFRHPTTTAQAPAATTMSDSEGAAAASSHPTTGGKSIETVQAQQNALQGERQPYKSWRKKYRKMRVKFDAVLEENKTLFKQEHKLEGTAKRLREELE